MKAEQKARVAKVQEQARERERIEQGQSETVPAPGSNVVKLPLWPEAVRAVPNGFLRSALFGAIAKGRRRFMKAEEVAALDGITIRYTGESLDQGDLDVWETVLHLTREQTLGETCRVTGYQLLKVLGKADTGGNREVLHNRLTRLKATALEVDLPRFSYMGSLIDEVFKEKASREYVIRLNPKLRMLFETEEFTQLDWTVRQSLEGKPLAQWLHAFYASHAKPYPVRVETLHKLCGSETERMDHFREKLRKALDALTEASAAHGEGFSYEIRGDLVYVEKNPSGAQRRHLAKKTAKLQKTRD